MLRVRDWVLFLHLALTYWARIVGAANSSVAFSPALGGPQQFITGPESQSSYIQSYSEYLRLSLKHELPKRLSARAAVTFQGEEQFTALDARYTNYKRPQYIAIVQPAEERDVVESVNYARSRGIQFVARAGGHSLTSSLRRLNNAIAIDMRNLKNVQYDEKTRQITVGGGITTGEFANATHSKGMEVTVGSCPCTGVMGISLGAGIGRLQGKYGYLNDNMISARLLLANSTIVEVSEKTNKSLFWALRGAGHNFGIVLEATYQVYPQLNDGKHFVVDFEFELDKLEEIFDVLNAISDPMPKELAVFVIGRRKGANGKPTININLVYSGPEEEAVPFVKRFDEMSHVWKDTKTASWDALPWATYNGLNNVLCTPEGWARFPIKNFYGANVKKYDIATMRSYFDPWQDMNERYKGEAMFSVMFESFPQQRVRELPDDATAYPWRHGSQHFLMIEAAYKDPIDEEVIDEWLSRQQDRFIETSGYGRLQQYVNYGHGSKDPPEALYGYEPWRLEKLRRLKKEYDPEGFFNGYQPVLDEDELNG